MNESPTYCGRPRIVRRGLEPAGRGPVELLHEAVRVLRGPPAGVVGQDQLGVGVKPQERVAVADLRILDPLLRPRLLLHLDEGPQFVDLDVLDLDLLVHLGEEGLALAAGHQDQPANRVPVVAGHPRIVYAMSVPYVDFLLTFSLPWRDGRQGQQPPAHRRTQHAPEAGPTGPLPPSRRPRWAQCVGLGSGAAAPGGSGRAGGGERRVWPMILRVALNSRLSADLSRIVDFCPLWREDLSLRGPGKQCSGGVS